MNYSEKGKETYLHACSISSSQESNNPSASVVRGGEGECCKGLCNAEILKLKVSTDIVVWFGLNKKSGCPNLNIASEGLSRG